MRADNQGEGGILALTALIPGRDRQQAPGAASRLAIGRPVLIALGVFGTALLYGDGMITPAISVLGAIEGLEVATPLFTPYVVPITVSILVVLFSIQRFGTHRVGGLFGPIVIVWFVTIAVLGITWIVREPSVLSAFDPRHAITFFGRNGFHGFAVLGAVFLVVTGGEALYADMGHFGRNPIRIAWFALVLPALVLNYLGQGALLLEDPRATHPFFHLAPSWALYPLVGVATAAAIIASQALISGSFSITRQAVQLGLAPRLDVEHTSAHEMGQIYVPQVNWALMVATVLIVIGFGSSGAVASAYGIAVTLTMIITVLLLYTVMTERWRWPKPGAIVGRAHVPGYRCGVLRSQRPQDPGRRVGDSRRGLGTVHRDDNVALGSSHPGRATHGSSRAVGGLLGAGCRNGASASAWDGRVHDGATDRYTARARA